MKKIGVRGSKGSSRKPVPMDAAASPLDEFDQEKRIDLQLDTCGFCRQGHEYGLLLRRLLKGKIDMKYDEDDNEFDVQIADDDIHLVWVSAYSLKIQEGRRAFAHFFCALTSPLAWYNEKRE
jgi:hypothetical protein